MNSPIKYSVCIVSYNRFDELDRTLHEILKCLETDTEVLVWLDGCTDDSHLLASKYPNVKWNSSKQRMGGSRCRKSLYNIATGEILIGFDDDSHPLTQDFISLTQSIFDKNPDVGILAFRIWWSRHVADASILNSDAGESLMAGDFTGCGFAIRRDCYFATGGFPDWMNIYGEELYLSIKAFSKGFSIRYSPEVLVQHRVDPSARRDGARSSFWFYHQLRNNALLTLTLYPWQMAIVSFVKLWLHNFNKYVLTGKQSIWLYLKAFFAVLFALPAVSIKESRLKSSQYRAFRKFPLPVYSWKPLSKHD